MAWSLYPCSERLTAQGQAACHTVSSALILTISTRLTHLILYDSLAFFPPCYYLMCEDHFPAVSGNLLSLWEPYRPRPKSTWA